MTPSLNKCNFCTLESLRAYANQTAQILECKPAIVNKVKGTDVYVGGTWAAWLWTTPDHCVCYHNNDVTAGWGVC